MYLSALLGGALKAIFEVNYYRLKVVASEPVCKPPEAEKIRTTRSDNSGAVSGRLLPGVVPEIPNNIECSKREVPKQERSRPRTGMRRGVLNFCHSDLECVSDFDILISSLQY